VRWFWWRVNATCEVVAMVSSFVASITILTINKLHLATIRHAVTASLQTVYADQPAVLQAKLRAGMDAASVLPPYIATHQALLLTIGFTTLCWLVAAYVGPETNRDTLIAFYRKVRPFGPGWRHIRLEAAIAESDIATGENIPLALLGWVAGCTMIWSSLFTVGNFLYGRTNTALLLLATCAVSGTALIYVVRRLWTGGNQQAGA